jgi:hypothetical protein
MNAGADHPEQAEIEASSPSIEPAAMAQSTDDRSGTPEISGNPFRRLWTWLHSPSPPPKPDATVEVAWLPLWQAQLVLHELWERSIPSVMSEDHTSHLRFGAREPMARVFVIAARAELAARVIEEVTGQPPIGQSGQRV